MALALRLRRAIPFSTSVVSHITHGTSSSSSPLFSSQPFPILVPKPIPRLLVHSQSFKTSSMLSSYKGGIDDDSKIGPDDILFEGCDCNHCLITIDFPKDPRPSAEEMVETYVQTGAKVFGRIMAGLCMRAHMGVKMLNNANTIICNRGFAAGPKSKKGGKGGTDGPKASALTKEMKSNMVYGANILKEGTDPKILPDYEYPDWLGHLLDKKPPLSELRRKDKESLTYEELKRYVKLDNRARIKENDAFKAKK